MCRDLHFTRPHALRGIAVLTLCVVLVFAGGLVGTQSVEEAVPTRSVGTRGFEIRLGFRI